MDLTTYINVVDKLDDYLEYLKQKALDIINQFDTEMRFHKVSAKCLALHPIVESVENQNSLRIGWKNDQKNEVIYNPIVSTTDSFEKINNQNWYIQLIKNTEKGLLEIKAELEFLGSIFKKVDFWKTNVQ
ncbi:MAG: hypothetical protein UHG91_03435 [Succinivibrionaceae bacterium]|nr:hypothetical protein [Succinivibrionaceae bacterium]MEE1339823.1 hypothetical protein [Succinivibrionaceae bacterium]